MRETGIIISKQGKSVQVRLQKSKKCEGCTACASFGPNSMAIEAHNEIDAEIGDVVDVEISPKQVVGHSLVIFLFPIVAMIFGYFLGMRIGGYKDLTGEGSGILGALVMLVISFLVIKLYDSYQGHQKKNSAYVVSRSKLASEDDRTV